MNNTQTKNDTTEQASTANFCYAVETLEIEINRIKSLLRKIDANIHQVMSDIPAYNEYADKKEELEKAVKLLSA